MNDTAQIIVFIMSMALVALNVWTGRRANVLQERCTVLEQERTMAREQARYESYRMVRMHDAWRLTDPEGFERWRKGRAPDFFWPHLIVNVPVDGVQQEGG